MQKDIKTKLLSIPITFLCLTIATFIAIFISAPNGDHVLKASTQSYRTDIKDLKHYYAQLAGYNVILLDHVEENEDITNSDTDEIISRTIKDMRVAINNIKSLSYTITRLNDIDLSVLVAFLDNYETDIRKGVVQARSHRIEGLMTLQKANQYFSRINSEYFFILDELERSQWDFFNQERLKSRFTTYALQTLIFLMIVISTFQCLHFARTWKSELSSTLQKIYRFSVKDFSNQSTTEKTSSESDDEIGFMNQSVNEMGKTLAKHSKNLEKSVYLLKAEKDKLAAEKKKLVAENAYLNKHVNDQKDTLASQKDTFNTLHNVIEKNDILLSAGSIALKSMGFLSQQVKNSLSNLQFMVSEVTALQNSASPSKIEINNTAKHLTKESTTANEQLQRVQKYLDNFSSIMNDIRSSNKKVFHIGSYLQMIGEILNQNLDLGAKIKYETSTNIQIDHQPGLFAQLIIQMIMAELEFNSQTPNIINIDIILKHNNNNLELSFKDNGTQPPGNVIEYFSSRQESVRQQHYHTHPKIFHAFDIAVYRLASNLTWSHEDGVNTYHASIPVKVIKAKADSA